MGEGGVRGRREGKGGGRSEREGKGGRGVRGRGGEEGGMKRKSHGISISLHPSLPPSLPLSLPLPPSFPPSPPLPLPTTVKTGLKVWSGSVLHQHTLGLVRIERDFRSLGAHERDKVCCILVLLPAVQRQVVVGVTAMEVEAVVLSGRLVQTTR